MAFSFGRGGGGGRGGRGGGGRNGQGARVERTALNPAEQSALNAVQKHLTEFDKAHGDDLRARCRETSAEKPIKIDGADYLFIYGGPATLGSFSEVRSDIRMAGVEIPIALARQVCRNKSGNRDVDISTDEGKAYVNLRGAIMAFCGMTPNDDLDTMMLFINEKLTSQKVFAKNNLVAGFDFYKTIATEAGIVAIYEMTLDGDINKCIKALEKASGVKITNDRLVYAIYNDANQRVRWTKFLNCYLVARKGKKILTVMDDYAQCTQIAMKSSVVFDGYGMKMDELNKEQAKAHVSAGIRGIKELVNAARAPPGGPQIGKAQKNSSPTDAALTGGSSSSSSSSGSGVHSGRSSGEEDKRLEKSVFVEVTGKGLNPEVFNAVADAAQYYQFKPGKMFYSKDGSGAFVGNEAKGTYLGTVTEDEEGGLMISISTK